MKRSSLRHVALVTAAALVAAFICIPVAAPARAAEPTALEATQADVVRRWPALAHLSTEEAATLLAKGEAVLFDVRQPEEYAVSRLASAIWVDPGTRRADFMKQHHGTVRGKTVVFYCAVGVRSSKLAERVAADLRANGATAVHNISGGIFAWHNERRPLVDDSGATDLVHPFDRHWGRLIDRQDRVSTGRGD